MIEELVVDKLRKKGRMITTAESCTGGMIASRLVNVPGASAVFKEGYITYSDAAKVKMLGVDSDTIRTFGAVSKETAYEMALCGAKKAEADICIAVTGVAGPSEEDGKPVGLVYIGCSYLGSVNVKEYSYTGNRADIRGQAAEDALSLVYDTIMADLGL